MLDDFRVNGVWQKAKKVEGKTVQTISASVWYNMLRRCRGDIDNPSYAGCSVSPEFLDFQYFALWHTGQVGYGQGFHLDKDLLIPGNKVYGEDRCLLIPQEVNNFITDRRQQRGKCKVGVYKHTVNGTYVANTSVDGRTVYLGSFTTEDAAKEVYRESKHRQAIELACRLDAEYHIDPRVARALKERFKCAN